MTEAKDDGGPAFPQERLSHMEAVSAGPNAPAYVVPHYVHDGGMSLRDWFAGQALLGILSGPASRDAVPMTEWFDAPEQAYLLADAMLAERHK